MSFHYLEKKIASGHLFWQIEVKDDATIVLAGNTESEPQEFPPRKHASNMDAQKYAERQADIKKRQRYKPVDNVVTKLSKKDSIKRRTLNPSDVKAATKRAKKLLHNIEEEDGDTDSVSSSASHSRPLGSGISPLNRRRSLRLKLLNKDLSKMDTEVGTLQNQNTIYMASPELKLERMDTPSRWSDWRQKSKARLEEQETVIPAKIKRVETVEMKTPKVRKQPSKFGKWRQKSKSPTPYKKSKVAPESESDTLDSDVVDGSKVSLLKKQSTTWGLRQSLAQSRLNSVIPNIFEEDTTEQQGEPSKRPRSLLNKQSTTRAIKRQLSAASIEKQDSVKSAGEVEAGLLDNAFSDRKLKRKSNVLLSPTLDMVDSPLPEVLSSENEDVDEVDAGAVRPKKQSFDEVDKNEPKVNNQDIYRPSKKKWPCRFPAQVVWGVPLKHKNGTVKNGLGVFVDPHRCLIGDESGQILELDSAVVPTQLHQLHDGVKCIVEDAEFIYAGCNDGGVYDITCGEPRLVFHLKSFGQIYSLDVFDGRIVASDEYGNVAMCGYDGRVLWKKKSDGEFGWMVKIDNTGVYHGHSKGVTKYSLENGAEMYTFKAEDGIFSGVQTSDHLFVASGSSVMKIKKKSGKIKQKYNLGKMETRSLHSCAVGGGMVFAGGNKIVCYGEESGKVIYVLSHQFKPVSMQYFQTRLYCVGKGAMTVLDFTEASINTALNGKSITTTEVSPTPMAPCYTQLKKITKKKSLTQTGVVLECCSKPKLKNGVKRVKILSPGYKEDWDIQLPQNLLDKGGKYFVDGLRGCQPGSYYRIYGNIQQLQG